MQAPTAQQTGKGAKIFMSFNDGVQVNNLALTRQASYNYNGEVLTKRVYLLGNNKMINSRPAVNSKAFVDGILDGIDVSSTVSNEIATSAGSQLVNDVVAQVAADASVAFTRPASTQAAWYAVIVDKATGAITIVKGTDTTAGTGKTGLATTYGTGAGEKPLIDTDKLLACYLKLDSTAGTVAGDEVDYTDREWAGIGAQIDSSRGAVIISEELKELHTGGVARDVKFTGKYWDPTALAKIVDGIDWSVTPNTSTVSQQKLEGGASETVIDTWSFAFNHLFTDVKPIAAMFLRQGYAAVKLQLASGHYWQFVGTQAGGVSASAGAYVNQPVTGSVQGQPYWSGMDS